MLETLVNFAAVGFVIWLVLYVGGRCIVAWLNRKTADRYAYCNARVVCLLSHVRDARAPDTGEWTVQTIKNRLARASVKNKISPRHWSELVPHIWLQIRLYQRAAELLAKKVPLGNEAIYAVAFQLDLAILDSTTSLTHA